MLINLASPILMLKLRNWKIWNFIILCAINSYNFIKLYIQIIRFIKYFISFCSMHMFSNLKTTFQIWITIQFFISWCTLFGYNFWVKFGCIFNRSIQSLKPGHVWGVDWVSKLNFLAIRPAGSWIINYIWKCNINPGKKTF